MQSHKYMHEPRHTRDFRAEFLCSEIASRIPIIQKFVDQRLTFSAAIFVLHEASTGWKKYG